MRWPLGVLRREAEDNYYAAFDLVPLKYRPLLQQGKVLVTNWHGFGAESGHKEGDKTYAVVNKGPETTEDFANRVLKELAERMPILVLNDEGHHCWRPKARPEAARLTGEDKAALEAEVREATVWIDGLDKLNNAPADGSRGISFCLDLSATPFFIQGSGYPEGRPFPWIISDFGLVDAIESGLVKIPRLPVQDTTGRPDPAYFRLWERMRVSLQPWELLPGTDLTLVLEVKGHEDDQTKAKHGAAKRWFMAVNNWGKLGRWRFHVCRDPAILEREIAYPVREARAARGDRAA